jgi:hypothetical protein
MEETELLPYWKKYYLANKERLYKKRVERNEFADFYKKHKEEENARCKEYYKKHREEILKKKQEARLKKKEEAPTAPSDP